MFPNQAYQFFFFEISKMFDLCLSIVTDTPAEVLFNHPERRLPGGYGEPLLYQVISHWGLSTKQIGWRGIFQLSLFKSLLWCEVLWLYNNKMYDNPWKEELNFCWYTGMRHLHVWLIYQSYLWYWCKYVNRIYLDCYFISFSNKNYVINEEKIQKKNIIIKFPSQGLGCP